MSSPALIRGCDAADIDGMVRNVSRIKAAGLDFVMTYLKYTKAEHITALHNAGLAVGLIFEAGTQNALQGAPQGTADRNRAGMQADAIGAPVGTPIFFTVDTDVANAASVKPYADAFGSSAGYADGNVLAGLNLRYPWLAGAMGWSGSRDYFTNGLWAICQGTPMRGGHQLGMDWPDLGFEYDPDIARNLDWAWMPAGQPQPSPSPTPVTAIPTAREMQTALVAAGFDVGPSGIDGIWGDNSSDALWAYYNPNG